MSANLQAKVGTNENSLMVRIACSHRLSECAPIATPRQGWQLQSSERNQLSQLIGSFSL